MALADLLGEERPSPRGVVAVRAREVELADARVIEPLAGSNTGFALPSIETEIGTPRDWRATYAVSASNSSDSHASAGARCFVVTQALMRASRFTTRPSLSSYRG
jgi:hypothetical protein